MESSSDTRNTHNFVKNQVDEAKTHRGLVNSKKRRQLSDMNGLLRKQRRGSYFKAMKFNDEN